jgi:hypothetical protein
MCGSHSSSSSTTSPAEQPERLLYRLRQSEGDFSQTANVWPGPGIEYRYNFPKRHWELRTAITHGEWRASGSMAGKPFTANPRDHVPRVVYDGRNAKLAPNVGAAVRVNHDEGGEWEAWSWILRRWLSTGVRGDIGALRKVSRATFLYVAPSVGLAPDLYRYGVSDAPGLDNAHSAVDEVKVWKQANGRVLDVRDMNLSHLENAAKLCVDWTKRYGKAPNAKRVGMCENVFGEVMRRQTATPPEALRYRFRGGRWEHFVAAPKRAYPMLGAWQASDLLAPLAGMAPLSTATTRRKVAEQIEFIRKQAGLTYVPVIVEAQPLPAPGQEGPSR